MRISLLPACLVTAIGAGMAVAQSPVAYVYVAEDQDAAATSLPITTYAAFADGRLTQIQGSPFKQTSGVIAGTNGTHFITVDTNNGSAHQYLHVYNVAANGVIEGEVSKYNLSEWCSSFEGAEFDHTGQFVYVLDAQSCGGGYQSFSLSKSGYLTFRGSLTINYNPFNWLPTFSGNDNYAYTFVSAAGSQPPRPTSTILGLGRESSGALENISFNVTGPTPPCGYQPYPDGPVTDDATNHLAAYVDFVQDSTSCSSGGSYGLASYTVQSTGDLVSTNASESMPQFDGYLNQGGYVFDKTFLLNPAGNILAASVGSGIQFFHFNGANPITRMTGIVGNLGYITTMAWDKNNHLYALEMRSGKLHVFTVTTTGAVEAPGSPYTPPNTCTSSNGCMQDMVVRIVP